MGLVISDPGKIEARSFELINKYLKNLKLSAGQKDVVRRVIHATANPGFARELLFHPQAITAGQGAIKNGCFIVTDAAMVQAGINKKLLAQFGGKVVCLLNDRDIVRRSSRLKLTRAMLAMRKSARFMKGGIVAIGNAPTALFELCKLAQESNIRPALVVGVPVGFVGAVEAKKKLRTLNIPFITNKSRKGGSAVAAAIVNALLKIAESQMKSGVMS
ncbi:MAG: precorrin-8X methylmutase [Patescibacteria group bacterium]